MNRKTAAGNTKKSTALRNRRETALKAALSALVCLWMFVLGILVGRGTAPVRFDVQRIQDELASLKAAVVKQTTERYRTAFQEVDKQVDLGFHEALTDSNTDLVSTAPSIQESPRKEAPATVDDPDTAAEIPKKIKSSEFQKIQDHPAQWTIQVAATQDKAQGHQLVDSLKEKGFSAKLITATVPGKGTWYRIRVGGYDSRAEAEEDRARLKKERFSPMLIKP